MFSVCPGKMKITFIVEVLYSRHVFSVSWENEDNVYVEVLYSRHDFSVSWENEDNVYC